MPDDKPQASFFSRLRNHLRRRLLIGLVVFTPFGLTFWILLKFVTFSKDLLTKPINRFLDLVWEGTQPAWVQYPALAVSILLAIFLLYAVGVISATFIGKRYIAQVESLLLRIPGIQFCYNTIKQVIEIVSRPRSEAFQRVVMIEYPRKGIRGLAFFSGITVLPETGEAMVNVFIPTTPNPTSGFLLLMQPDEVQDTNLTVSDATRFIISGGVVALEHLQLSPFPIAEYAGEIKARRKALVGNEPDDHPAPPAGDDA